MNIFEANNVNELKDKLIEYYDLLTQIRVKSEYKIIKNGLYGYINEHDRECQEESDYFYADEDITYEVLTKDEFVDNIINNYSSNKINCKYFVIGEF